MERAETAADRDRDRSRAHLHPDAQGVRRWAVEQVMGALVPGNKATPTDIIGMADKLATYVLTGTTS